MDVLLLLVQIALAVLLVVMPLFSAYDKWQVWSVKRRVIAVAFAVGIAVVAFSQYQRTLHLRDLEHSIPNVGLLRGPWYARRVGATIWEFVGLALAGSVLLTLSWESARKKRWHYVAASLGVFALMLGLVMMLKLRAWGD
jgi:hypothetical protein